MSLSNGYSGICTYCGHSSGTLFKGACNDCRYKYAMKMKRKKYARMRKQRKEEKERILMALEKTKPKIEERD